MYIKEFNVFFVKKTNNNFQINKYSQNPISFRGGLETDTIELRTNSAINSGEDLSAKYQQDKEDVLKRFEAETARNSDAITNAITSRTILEDTKNLALTMVDDEEFLSQIEDSLLTYQEESAKKKAFIDIDTLLKKPKVVPEKKEKTLSSLISRNFPSYMDSSTNIVSTAKKIRREQRQEIEDLNPDMAFEKGIDNALMSYSEKNSVQVPLVVKTLVSEALLETVGKTSDDFKACLALKFDKEIELFATKIADSEVWNSLRERQKQDYLSHFEKDPVSASCYTPFFSHAEIVRKLEATGSFKQISRDSFPLSLIRHLEEGGLLHPFEEETRAYSFSSLYDLRDEDNKRVIDLLSGNEGKLDYQADVTRKYLVPGYVVDKLPIKKIHFEFDNWRGVRRKVVLLDPTDAETIQLLEAESEKWKRTRTQRSKYAFDNEHPCKEEEIPAAYLAKLGFGNIPTLRKLVEGGALAGKVEEVQTEEGTKYKTTLSSRDPRLKNVLTTLRTKNKGVASYKDLAKELGISQKRLLQDIADGKIDIIPEHMFVFDNEYKYIDKRTEKNSSYIQTTLFEQELAYQLKQQQNEQKREEIKQKRIKGKDALSRFNSLRMSLVWHFCPNTKAIASRMAVSDGYLCKLLVKDSEDEESLTRKEQIKVNSYRNEMWTAAGTDELKEGHKKANAVLKQLKESGLNSIEDPEVRKILEDYGFIS